MHFIIKIRRVVFAYVGNLEPVSVYIINCGLLLSAAALFAANLIFAIPGSFFPDPATTSYWSGECFLLAKELLGATVVTSLLFENLLTLLQMKSNANEQNR